MNIACAVVQIQGVCGARVGDGQIHVAVAVHVNRHDRGRGQDGVVEVAGLGNDQPAGAVVQQEVVGLAALLLRVACGQVDIAVAVGVEGGERDDVAGVGQVAAVRTCQNRRRRR